MSSSANPGPELDWQRAHKRLAEEERLWTVQQINAAMMSIQCGTGYVPLLPGFSQNNTAITRGHGALCDFKAFWWVDADPATRPYLRCQCGLFRAAAAAARSPCRQAQALALEPTRRLKYTILPRPLDTVTTGFRGTKGCYTISSSQGCVHHTLEETEQKHEAMVRAARALSTTSLVTPSYTMAALFPVGTLVRVRSTGEPG